MISSGEILAVGHFTLGTINVHIKESFINYCLEKYGNIFYRFHIRFGDLAYIKSLKYSSIYIFRTIVDDGIYQNLVLINAMSDNPMAAASFVTLKKVP